MSDDTTWFWNIVDARGLANVSSDEFVALNEIICDAERSEAELNAISAAIGSPRFMDPPDGGSVTLAEQVVRMRETLEQAEDALRDVMSWIDNYSPDFIGDDEWPATCDRAVAAIAKAGGRMNLADAPSNQKPLP